MWWQARDLRIHANRLSGTLPIELSYVHPMKELSLWDNQISGTLPPSIGDLGDLHDMSLSYNSISGSLPTELGLLTGMTYALCAPPRPALCRVAQLSLCFPAARAAPLWLALY